MASNGVGIFLPATYDYAWSSVLVLYLGLAVWALVQIARRWRRGGDGLAALVWALVVVFVPIIGAGWYLISTARRSWSLHRSPKAHQRTT